MKINDRYEIRIVVAIRVCRNSEKTALFLNFHSATLFMTIKQGLLPKIQKIGMTPRKMLYVLAQYEAGFGWVCGTSEKVFIGKEIQSQR
jgi:hypothetical protein